MSLRIRTVFLLGAQYAQSADELLALWQQARGALPRTRASVNG